MTNNPKWTQESLKKAMEEVKQGLGKRKAAEKYGIPWGTFSDKLSGRRNVELASKTYMTPKEEQEVVNFLLEMGKRGFGKTKEELFTTVKNMLDFNNRQTKWPDNMPSEKWFRLFTKRHPEIVFRKPQRLGKQRAIITPNEISNWFASYAETIKNIDPTILLEPARIYNCDESGFSLDALTGRVLSFVGTKFVYQVGSDNRTMITALICASAAGHYTWPMLIYPGTQFRGFQPNEVFVDSFITKSKNGWINQDIFAEWLESVFVPQTSQVKKPLVLLVDGHVSHKSLRASQICQDNGVILYALPAHSSHILQPLDVGVFKTMKCEWKKAVKKQNEAEIITKRTFAVAFKETYENTVCRHLAAQAFRKSGLYPLDQTNIDWSKIIPPTISTSSEDCRSSPDTVDHLKDVNIPPASDVQTQSANGTLLQSIAASSQSQSETVCTEPESTQMADDEPSTSSTSNGRGGEHALDSTVRKFALMCAQIGENQLNNYFVRLEEGFDCHDSVYSLWKNYYTEIIRASSSSSSRTGANQSTTDSTQAVSKDPLTIPSLIRGTRKRQSEKVPPLLSGHDFREQLIRKDDAQKETERKKAQRKNEMEEKKKKKTEMEEVKKRKREERKKEMEERKKQKEEEVRKRKEDRDRKLKEKQSDKNQKRRITGKTKSKNLSSDDETSVDECAMVLDDDSDYDLSYVMVNDSFDFQNKIATAIVSEEVGGDYVTVGLQEDPCVTDETAMESGHSEQQCVNVNESLMDVIVSAAVPDTDRSLWELFTTSTSTSN